MRGHIVCKKSFNIDHNTKVIPFTVHASWWTLPAKCLSTKHILCIIWWPKTVR